MRILYDVVHPAGVHFFRKAIDFQTGRGDEVAVASREKDIALVLLDRFGIPHRKLTRRGKGTTGLAVELLQRDHGLWRLAREFRPDILVANNSPCVSHVGRLIKRPSLIFDDTEIHRLNRWLYYPFATEVHYPQCYSRKIRRQHRRYPSYHALAYLHPDHFEPDVEVLRQLGLDPERKRVLIRFVAYHSAHDLGREGLPMAAQRRIITALGTEAEILISSERPLPPDLDPYRIESAPEKTHHLLAFSDLIIGESATMCAEAAMLGTPAIYIDTETRGYTDDLMNRYQLCFHWQSHQIEQILRQAFAILTTNAKTTFRAARARMLSEHIDAAAYQVEQIDRIVRDFTDPPPTALRDLELSTREPLIK
jgi:predicted glycosyltransferase